MRMKICEFACLACCCRSCWLHRFGEGHDEAVATKHSAWKVQARSVRISARSVHVLKEENYPLPAVFESAFSNASVSYSNGHRRHDEAGDADGLMTKAQLPEGSRSRTC